MGSGFSKMKKQARAMQQQYQDMQEQLKTIQVIGHAGNGLVEVTMNGEKEVLAIHIKPQCVDPNDIEGLQDLIVAAMQDAHKKAEEKSMEGNPMASLGSLPFNL